MREAPRRRHGVTSGLAAFTVVLVTVFLWWLLSGNGPQGPSGNDSRFAVPDTDATADGVEPGGGSVGSPGSGSAEPDRGEGGSSSSQPVMTNQNGVRIDGFVLESADRITLNYATGPPECTGALDTPEVLETDAAVTVTLTLRPPETPPEQPCPELAQLRSVHVDLDTALGDRSVLDGSFAQRVLVRETDTANE